MKIKRKPTPHPTQTKTPEVITYRVLKEFRRDKLTYNAKQNWVVYWVVQWSNQTAPVFEKRRIYVLKNGTIRTYKVMGLTQDDIQWMYEYLDDIADAVQVD